MRKRTRNWVTSSYDTPRFYCSKHNKDFMRYQQGYTARSYSGQACPDCLTEWRAEVRRMKEAARLEQAQETSNRWRRWRDRNPRHRVR